MSAATRTSSAARPLLWNRRRFVPYLFILPSFLFLVAFVFWPLGRALYLSFTKWAMIGPPPRFVGINNYLCLLDDPQFANAVGNTVYYTLGSVPTGIVVGLGLALLMNQPLRARALLRSAYFFPTVTSTVAVSLVWLYMFDVHLGVVSYLLGEAGLPTQKWLHDPVMAMPVIVLYGLWHGVGYTMMIFLAGLQAIPADLYEAAMVDGADRRASFRHITEAGHTLRPDHVRDRFVQGFRRGVCHDPRWARLRDDADGSVRLRDGFRGLRDGLCVSPGDGPLRDRDGP